MKNNKDDTKKVIIIFNKNRRRKMNMILNTMNDLKRIFDETEQFLKTQWYRRHEALKYELEDLKRALDVLGQYDDEFTFDEMKTYKEYEAEYDELLKEYEVGGIAC